MPHCSQYVYSIVAILPVVASKAKSVAHVLSRVLKIESALFPGNRSHAPVMFRGSLGGLYHAALLVLKKKQKNCAFKKRERYRDKDGTGWTKAVIQKQG